VKKVDRSNDGYVRVSSLMVHGERQLGLELVAGAGGLRNIIREGTVNRPGLALSGFFDHFPHRRMQVLGLAEYAYLSCLSEKDRHTRLVDFFSRKLPCVIITRGRKVFPEIKALAEENNIPVFSTKMITMNFINAITILMENLMAPRMSVQGTMVEIMGIGVLIEGSPSMGKSEAALGLIRKGYALVSDDITASRLDSAGSLIGAPVNVTRYHMEIRGIGIIHVPSLFGVASVRAEKKLDLVVTLCSSEAWKKMDQYMSVQSKREFFGVPVPQIILPVAPGRDMSNIIETAALDQRLKGLGHDATKELDEKLIQGMDLGKDASE